MHVVQCLTHSGIGGGQEVVYTLVRLLREGHPAVMQSVVMPAGGLYEKRIAGLGVPVITLPLDRLSLRTLWEFGKVLERMDVDIIHSHGKGAGFYARQSFPQRLKARRVHSFHGFHPHEHGFTRGWYLWLERHLLHNTDVVVGVSAGERDEIISLLPGAADRIVTIPNIVDCQEYFTREGSGLPVAVEKFLESHRKSMIVTMIGRNDPVKNHDLAYAASRLILQRRNDFAFLWIGIPPGDAGYVGVQTSYPDHVMAVESLPATGEVLRRSGVLMMTSRKEGCPLVVLEAGCAGIPVVGTRVAGIRDLVADGRTGILCAERPESVASALEQLADEPGIYDRFRHDIAGMRPSVDPVAWSNAYMAVYSKLS